MSEYGGGRVSVPPRWADLLIGIKMNTETPAGFSFDDGIHWGARLDFATRTRLILPE